MLALIAADVVQRARKTFARGLAWFVTLHEDNRIWRFSPPVSLSVCLSVCLRVIFHASEFVCASCLSTVADTRRCKVNGTGGSRNLRRGAVPPVPFFSPSSLPFPAPSPLPSPLEIGPLNQVEGLGALQAPPVGSGAGSRPKTNLVHFKAARKPLMTII